MPDDLRTTRTALRETTETIRSVRRSMTRRTIVTALGFLLVFAGLIYTASVVRDNSERIETAEQRQIKILQEKRQTDIERCERSNDTANVARLLLRFMYEDYGIAPANQTPERQTFLANRYNQRQAELDRVKPIQDCDALPRPDDPPPED